MAITTYSELQTAIANWLERDDLTSRITEFISLAESRHRNDVRLRGMQKRQSLLSGTSFSITDITQANPGVVTTSAAHGYADGDTVYIQGCAGMVEVNNREFTVANKTLTTFELSGEDTSATAADYTASTGEVIKVGANERYSILPDDFLGERSIYLTDSSRYPLTAVSPAELDRQSQTGTGKPRTYAINGDELEFDRAPDSTYSGVMRYYAAVEPLSAGNTSNLILANHPDLYLYGSLVAATPFLMHDERLQVWESMYQSALSAANKAARKQATSGSRAITVIGRGP